MRHGSGILTTESSAVLNILMGGGIGFAASVFAEPLRRWVYRPKLQLEFGKGREYQARTTEGIPPHVRNAEYIRIKVINTKPAIAKSCRAYLVGIEKSDETEPFKPTIYCDSIPLAWACKDEGEKFGAIDLPRGISQFVDVISTRSVSRDFSPHLKFVPQRYIPLFAEHGVFRFTIQVSGEDLKPAFIKIVFRWAGVWDKYEAHTS
jgi:hypothetical protein